jgi:hypothetical protein
MSWGLLVSRGNVGLWARFPPCQRRFFGFHGSCQRANLACQLAIRWSNTLKIANKKSLFFPLPPAPCLFSSSLTAPIPLPVSWIVLEHTPEHQLQGAGGTVLTTSSWPEPTRFWTAAYRYWTPNLISSCALHLTSALEHDYIPHADNCRDAILGLSATDTLIPFRVDGIWSPQRAARPFRSRMPATRRSFLKPDLSKSPRRL